MTIIICPDCGKEQDNLNKFCRNCGADLSKVEVPKETVSDSSQEELNEISVEKDTSLELNEEKDTSLELNEEKDTSLEISEEKDTSLEISEEKDTSLTLSGEKDISLEYNNEKIKKCSNCGAELNNGVKFCPICGNVVEMSVNEVSKKLCPSCKTELNANENFCPNCGLKLDQSALKHSMETHVLEKKSVAVSVILSILFPGLGQFYNGHSNKGVYFIVLVGVSWILTLILIGILLYVLIWLWSIFDAYQSANAINKGEMLEDKLF